MQVNTGPLHLYHRGFRTYRKCVTDDGFTIFPAVLPSTGRSLHCYVKVDDLSRSPFHGSSLDVNLG